MRKLLLATTNNARFTALSAGIAPLGATIDWVASGGEVLETVAGNPVDLVVADEDLGDMRGLDVVKRLVAANPLINCALVSSLLVESYHAATEGLGIVMQLPSPPVAADGRRLMTRLNQILGECPPGP